MPRSGPGAFAYFALVAALLAVAPLLPRRGELLLDALAGLAGAGWCGLNLWRCRRAHCLVTAAGWPLLALLALAEAAIGRSVIGGDEQLVFLAVLAAGLVFEGLWYAARGTSALPSRTAPSRWVAAPRGPRRGARPPRPGAR